MRKESESKRLTVALCYLKQEKLFNEFGNAVEIRSS